MSPELARAESLIAEVPDFPEPGILFRDIMPLLADARALSAVTEAIARPFAGQFDAVVGVEARGFFLASAVALQAGVGFAPIRKAGKLPRPAGERSFTLEYGTATIEMQRDLAAGARVLLIDDVLATGGTLEAAQHLATQLGYEVIGAGLLFEIAGLGGRAKLGETRVHTVFADPRAT